MHESSMRHMQTCIEKHLHWSDTMASRKVVDLGAMNVNGSYRELYDPTRFEYVGIDMAPGPGVDLVITDPYKIPIADGTADVVISGQMLEHNEFFWKTFEEKVRILKDDGYIIMIAPSRGPIHKYPQDCYRFYPDAYAGLAKYTNSILIDCWMDGGQWGDLVGVFTKRYRPGVSQFDTSHILGWPDDAAT